MYLSLCAPHPSIQEQGWRLHGNTRNSYVVINLSKLWDVQTKPSQQQQMEAEEFS